MMCVMELIKDFLYSVFAIAIDKLSIVGVLGSLFTFILGIVITEYNVKNWFHHKRAWKRLLVCLALLILSVYLSFHVVASIIFVAMICLCTIIPLPHEWIMLFYGKKNSKWLEKKYVERWIISTSAKLRFYKLKIDLNHDENRQRMQVLLLDKVKTWDLFDFEYRRYILPQLDVLFRIGAVKSFKEECARLSRFDDTSYMQTNKTYLAYNEMKYENMVQTDVPIADSDDVRIVTLLNNLCAYEASGEKEKMANVVRELLQYKKKSIVKSELYHDLMHYYDEIKHDMQKADALADEVESIKVKDFGDYLKLLDVAFMHYRRVGNQEKVDKLIEKILIENEKKQQGEKQLITEIRMLYVIMDNGANWHEYSIRLFQNRQKYLKYNYRVGTEFIKETLRFLKDMNAAYGLSLQPHLLNAMFADFDMYIDPYIEGIEADLAKTDERFLYKRKELLMNKLELLKFKVKDNVVAIRNNNDEIYGRICDMCKYNDAYREHLHFLVVNADDILTVDKQIMECGELDADYAQSSDYKNYQNRRIAFINNAENIVCKLVDELEKRNFDNTIVYYVLYISYFYMMLGNKQRCLFFFSKFERYEVNVKDWTTPIQQIYNDIQNYSKQSN